ncbi:M61 family metallopeptidase [Litoribacter alkaliphilus]|uniref:M61 family metallopeptidase n=1 Tax=Litoribacter ruber TaxID=702568 RepID=A0AAP2CHA1_9BACT|nr:M61 family peptidase [Litoribacter alkaliphilus]MBS9523765.1 M61 family metallopeptidase [Litoribacter alkaliphilus]
MQYYIKRNNILSQFIQIRLELYCRQGEKVLLQLPAWRPGRYELAHYAQKLRGFKVFLEEKPVASSKATKDLFTFTAENSGTYSIQCDFHACQMDAGGSWSDDEQLYLNFINFVFEVKGRENEPIKVTLDLPGDFKTATALPKIDKHTFEATDFQHLVDSPLFASPTLKHDSYNVDGKTFHLWFQGEVHFDVEKLKLDFKAFTRAQMNGFGDFPAREYHFLIQLLPYKHYHGVEHQYSTVITIGPAEELGDKKLYDELMGVSSHELYHFWNVCRIRPKEILPYDFSKEAYIKTGVVAEGVTTYMGDYYLLQSGYFSLENYLEILQKQLDREFESFGWQSMSITDSSFDLWLDGYKAGIPDRKVSIYNRGALISLTLDLMLLDQQSSLQEVMNNMWQKYGDLQKGYLLEDYQQIIAGHLGEKETEQFFSKYIKGTQDIREVLFAQLGTLGLEVKAVPRANRLEAAFGIITNEEGIITKIHPHGPNTDHVMQMDRIVEINGQPFTSDISLEADRLDLKINRYGRILNIRIHASAEPLYLSHRIDISAENPKRTAWVRQS